MPVCYLVAALLALFVWKVPGNQVAAASAHGLVTTISLLYIIFGAILLLNTLQESGALRAIRQGFTDISNVAGGIHAWSMEIDPSVPTY